MKDLKVLFEPLCLGETLVVKPMGPGREAAQRVHEYLMNVESEHMSLYERYYKENFIVSKLKLNFIYLNVIVKIFVICEPI